MKSFSVIKVIIACLVFSAVADAYSETGKCSRISEETVRKHIPVSSFNILSAREVNGMCEIIVTVSGRIVPLYGNEEGLVSGDLFHEKQNTTKERIYEINKKSFLDNRKSIDELVAFEYKPAEIKTGKVLYMFTEPLCPYCHKAGGEVKAMADKYGFAVRILLVSMKGEEGKKKCVEAACRHFIFNDKFNLEEYNQIEWKKARTEDQFICQKGVELINKTEDLSAKLYIDGIPLFYLDNGDYVSGADMEALEMLVKQK